MTAKLRWRLLLEKRQEEKVEDKEKEEEDNLKLLFAAIARDSRRFIGLLLSEPTVNINRRYFGETPLQCAIRWRHSDLAVFLLERGADPAAKKIMIQPARKGLPFDWFELDCRQLAYDAGLTQVVHAIDHVQGKLFSFLPSPSFRPQHSVDQEGMFADVVDIPEGFFDPREHRHGGRFSSTRVSLRRFNRKWIKQLEEEKKAKETAVTFEYDRVLSAISRSKPIVNSNSCCRPSKGDNQTSTPRANSSVSFSSSSLSSYSSASSSVIRETKTSLLRKAALRNDCQKPEDWRRRRRDKIGIRDALFGACLDSK